jgi:hypothetical protein
LGEVSSCATLEHISEAISTNKRLVTRGLDPRVHHSS